MSLLDVFSGKQSIGQWLTGRGPEESYICQNADKVEDVVNTINNISKNDLTTARDQIYAAFEQLNSVPGVAEYIGTFDTAQYNEYFDYIGEAITTISDTMNTNCENIIAYDQVGFGTKFGATLGMIFAKPAEGFLSVIEDFGDGVLSAVGFVSGVIPVIGKDIQNGIGGIVEADWSHDIFQYDKWAKYSAITEDSAIGNGLRLGGKIGGYIAGGYLMAGAMGLSTTATYGTGLLKASGATWGGTAFAGITGIGTGTEEGLKLDLDYNRAFAHGLGQGAKQAAFAFAVGSTFDRIGAAKAAKTAKEGADDTVAGGTKGAIKEGEEGAVAGGSKESTKLLTGRTAGESADEVAGATTKATAGRTAGESADEVAGATTKATAGRAAGESADEVAGATTKATAGKAAGESADEVAEATTKGTTEEGTKTGFRQTIKNKVENTLSGVKQKVGAGRAAGESADEVAEATTKGAAEEGAKTGFRQTVKNKVGDTLSGAKQKAGNLAGNVTKPLKYVAANGGAKGIAANGGLTLSAIASQSSGGIASEVTGALVSEHHYQMVKPGLDTDNNLKGVAEKISSGNPFEEGFTPKDGSIVPDEPVPTPPTTDDGGGGNQTPVSPSPVSSGGGGGGGGGYTPSPSPGTTGDKTPDTTGDKTPDTTGDKTPDTTGDKTPDTTGDKTPDTTGDKTPDTGGGQNPGGTTYVVRPSEPTPAANPGGGYTAPAEPTHSGAEYNGKEVELDSLELENAENLEALEDMEETSSSIDNIINNNANKYNKIPTTPAPINTKNKSSGSVVPIAVGLSVAAAAGLGAKAYMDHKRNNEMDEEEYGDEEYDDFESEEWTGGDENTVELDYTEANPTDSEQYLEEDNFYQDEDSSYSARNASELAELQ